jgi:hypothetical protein
MSRKRKVNRQNTSGGYGQTSPNYSNKFFFFSFKHERPTPELVADKENLPPTNQITDGESLKILLQLRPDLKGEAVWFIPKKNKIVKGLLLFEPVTREPYIFCNITGRQFYSFQAWIDALGKKRIFNGSRSALATIFLEPTCVGVSVGTIIKGGQHVPYWNTVSEPFTISDIVTALRPMLTPSGRFSGVAFSEHQNSLALISRRNSTQVERHLLFTFDKQLFKVDIHVLGHEVKSAQFVPKRANMTNIINAMEHVFHYSICKGQSVQGISLLT